MHEEVKDGLEEYLAGVTGSQRQRTLRAHLAACRECHAEVSAMEELSTVFKVLRAAEPVAPAPGFFPRVYSRIESRSRASFWNWLVPDLAWAQRVAFASLLILTVLGTYLLSSDPHRTGVPTSPEVVMSHPALDHDVQPEDRDGMLVTLASFEQ